MKPFHLLLVTLLFLPLSCAKLSEFLESQAEIQEVKDVQIAKIKKQIAQINVSIEELTTMDEELQIYINSLQTTAAGLRQDLTAVDGKIDAVQTQLKADLSSAQTSLTGQISSARTELLAELSALRTETAGRLTTVDNALKNLEKQDSTLNAKIDSLKVYTDKGIQDTKDWASATFSTLEQYQSTTAEIAAIKADIQSVQTSMTEMETRINGKMAADITAAADSLGGVIRQSAADITAAYTTAIASAAAETQSAYTAAIDSAIVRSERSLKGWVSEQLTAYSTITDTDAKLGTLQSDMNTQLTSQKAYLESLIASLNTQLQARIDTTDAVADSLKGAIRRINSALTVHEAAIANNATAISELRTALETSAEEITAAYQQAITTAINTLDGRLSGELASQIAAVNATINTRIAEVNTAIAGLDSRVTDCETAITGIRSDILGLQSAVSDLQEKVRKLLARIQSISVVPTYSDGSVLIASGPTNIKFEILPRSASVELAELGTSVLSLGAVAVQTKASMFTQLPISKVVDNGEALIVTASGAALGSDFFEGNQAYTARLKVSDGNNECATEFFALAPITLNAMDLSATASANSYIVPAAGSYKFPAVQGNSATSVGEVAVAEVLWETFGTDVTPDIGDIITAAGYYDGYVYFSTSAPLKNGNAVIAAKDASGEILWSWHIWVCKDFDPEATAQEYYNNAGVMMDRNLGATSATPGDVGALGLLYQWGRKDPFLGGCQISYDSSTNQQKAASTITWPSTVSSTSSNGTIAYATSHPTTFITRNDNNYDNNYDWYYTGSSGTDDTRWQSSKTIYDPCPPGWRVPDGGAGGVWSKAAGGSSYFSGYPYDDTNKGMNFSGKFGSASTVWYSASGWLNYDDGSLNYVGYNGRWWSCTPYDRRAYRLGLNYSGGVYPSNGYGRAYGLSVRCQKEGTGETSPAINVVNAKDLSSGGTANSYIVSAPGTYKFRSVQGNSSTDVGVVASAEVLWESFGTDETPAVGDIIADVAVTGRYIGFKTPSTLKNGNAVIAAKDAEGNILWSWHIWVCKDFDPEATAQEYYNNAGVMMDRNLGATSATPGDVGALGLLYQWGRKDPFLGSSSVSSNDRAKSTITWPSTVSSNASNGTIAYAVAHPTTFITSNSSNYDWYYTGSSSTNNTRWQSSKMIYDPCPPGWRVPDGGANGVWSKAAGSSYFSGYPYDSTNQGMNFSGKFGSATTIWYPASGWLGGGYGGLSNVGNSGYWWSCSPYGGYAYRLYLYDDGRVYPSGNYDRAYGLSVRCLQE